MQVTYGDSTNLRFRSPLKFGSQKLYLFQESPRVFVLGFMEVILRPYGGSAQLILSNSSRFIFIERRSVT